MLILARKVGEEIIIDDRIHVKVVSVHGSRIRLGIAAPDNIRVYREEVADIYGFRNSDRSAVVASVE